MEVDDILGYDKLVAAENWGAPRKRSWLVKPVLSEVEGAASRNELWLLFLSADALRPDFAQIQKN